MTRSPRQIPHDTDCPIGYLRIRRLGTALDAQCSRCGGAWRYEYHSGRWEQYQDPNPRMRTQLPLPAIQENE